jgi:hypothetical protein
MILVRVFRVFRGSFLLRRIRNCLANRSVLRDPSSVSYADTFSPKWEKGHGAFRLVESP